LGLQKRDTTIVVQDDARLELNVISQPRPVDFSRRPVDNLLALPGFVYNSTAGKDITVILMDIGVNTDNSVSAFPNSPKD
jgi:hypothetical protein